MNQISNRIKIGTLVKLRGCGNDYHLVTYINETRVNLQVKGWVGSFQDGHILGYKNKKHEQTIFQQ